MRERINLLAIISDPWGLYYVFPAKGMLCPLLKPQQTNALCLFRVIVALPRTPCFLQPRPDYHLVELARSFWPFPPSASIFFEALDHIETGAEL